MAMYLKITDGTTTIDLLGNDTTNSFNLLAGAWAPNVARRKRSQMGGGSWAEDVVEALPLYAQSDTSAATILANLDTLAALMDQAQRWALGEAVDPVILRYSPNSDSVYLQAVILGPPDSGQAVVLPPTFSDDLYQKVVDGVTLQFKRRGLWLGAEESDTSSTVDNGEIMTMSLTAVTEPSPTVLKLGKLNYTTGPNQTFGGFVILAKASSDFSIINAEGLANGAFTSVSGSSNLARNTNILRYTPTVTTEVSTAFSSTLSFSPPKLGVFINARNSSSTESFTVWPRYQRTGKTTNEFSKKTTIPAGATDPKWYYLGTEGLGSILQVLALYATVTSTTGTPLLEIDTIVLVNMDNATVVTLHEGTIQNWTTADTLIYFDHRLLSKPMPEVYLLDNSTTTAKIDYDGVPSFFTKAATVVALYLSTGGDVSTHWRRSNDSSAVMSVYATVTRTAAYLVPR